MASTRKPSLGMTLQICHSYLRLHSNVPFSPMWHAMSPYGRIPRWNLAASCRSCPCPPRPLPRLGPALILSLSHFFPPARHRRRHCPPPPQLGRPPSSVASLPAHTAGAMSQRMESSSWSVSTRQERGGGSRADATVPPVGKETGLPLIPCPDCHLARVIELRAVNETPNKGRCFFKCPRNGVSFA
jgi:hypothetical protein